MKVMVTGGLGYIGSVLCEELLNKGYDVVCMDRGFFLDKTKGHPLFDRKGFKWIKDDIRYFDPKVLDGIDVVMDLAALSNDPSGELDPKKTMSINFEGRKRVAELSKKHKVKRYILASSCSIYGFNPGIMTEESPTNPLTTYAHANLKAEGSLNLASKDFVVTALRQATVYGISPRMRFDLAINGMVLGIYKNKKLNLMRDGTQLRPFVHVRDTSNAFIYVMNCEPDLVNGQIFNVGSNEENYKLYDLAKGISEKLLGEFRFEWYGSPDTRSYRVNFDKIKRLGYSTKHNAFDSAKEIYDALVSGIVQENPRTNTVGWYKHLLEMNEFLETIKVNGELL